MVIDCKWSRIHHCINQEKLCIRDKETGLDWYRSVVWGFGQGVSCCFFSFLGSRLVGCFLSFAGRLRCPVVFFVLGLRVFGSLFRVLAVCYFGVILPFFFFLQYNHPKFKKNKNIIDLYLKGFRWNKHSLLSKHQLYWGPVTYPISLNPIQYRSSFVPN